MFRQMFFVAAFLVMCFPKVGMAGAPVTDPAQLIPELVEKFQEVVRSKSVDFSKIKSQLLEKAMGFLPAGMFDLVKKVDLSGFKSIVPSEFADLASQMSSDPGARDDFVKEVSKSFNVGNASNFNEVVEKKNQMGNILNSMSYGQAVAAAESTKETRKSLDEITGKVNSCDEIDCTVKHINEIDVFINKMLATQLLLVAGEAEKKGFPAMINSSENDEEEETNG